MEVCQEEWGCWEGTAPCPQNSVEAEEVGDLGHGWASGYWSDAEVGLQAGRDLQLDFGLGPG